ncbi:MAG: Ig-like domain-containing protein [Anaeromyxobacter sp.]
MSRSVPGLLLVALSACRAEAPPAAPPVVPAAVLVEPSPVALRAGETAQLAAQANDALGQPIGGAPLAFETSDPGIVRVTPTGLATSSGSAGSARITVSSGPTRTAVPVTVTPAAPSKLERPTPGELAGVAGAPLPAPVAVRCLDPFGNPVAGAKLRVSALDGGAVASGEAVTDATGGVELAWTLGPRQGVQRLSVALDAAPGAALLVTAAARPGAPAKLTALAPPADAPAPAADGEQVLRVRVTDAHENPIPALELGWRVSAGRATVTSSGPTDADGVAEAHVRPAARARGVKVEAIAPGGGARPLVLELAAPPRSR